MEDDLVIFKNLRQKDFDFDFGRSKCPLKLNQKLKSWHMQRGSSRTEQQHKTPPAVSYPQDTCLQRVYPLRGGVPFEGLVQHPPKMGLNFQCMESFILFVVVVIFYLRT